MQFSVDIGHAYNKHKYKTQDKTMTDSSPATVNNVDSKTGIFYNVQYCDETKFKFKHFLTEHISSHTNQMHNMGL
jgi:hypothetical protein